MKVTESYASSIWNYHNKGKQACQIASTVDVPASDGYNQNTGAITFPVSLRIFLSFRPNRRGIVNLSSKLACHSCCGNDTTLRNLCVINLSNNLFRFLKIHNFIFSVNNRIVMENYL